MLMLYWKLELGSRKVESRGWWRWVRVRVRVTEGRKVLGARYVL
jgi:hypothetical protein